MAQKKSFLNYTDTVNQAIAKLDLAKTYADDGGHLDAASCAADAITLLFKATRQRNALADACERLAAEEDVCTE